MGVEITVTKANLRDFKKAVADKSSVLNEVFAVADECQKQRKDTFCFIATFPYGSHILENGRSCLLNPAINPATWKDPSGGRPEEVRALFQSSCGKNTDHPLAVVLENEVEVYSWRRVTLSRTTTDEWLVRTYFPLNRIGKGDWFGLYGTSDTITTHEKIELKRWDGAREWAVIAGRRCVSINVPVPLSNNSPAQYRKHFKSLFPKASDEYMDAVEGQAKKPTARDKKTLVTGLDDIVYDSVCEHINESLKTQAQTKVLIIPDHYFLVERGDKPALIAAKHSLQRRLLMHGWGQSVIERDILWRQRAVVDKSPEIETSSSKVAFNHLIDVVDGDGYSLRIVNKRDKVLYAGWQTLLELWDAHDLWDERCFPLMLTYEKGIPEDGSPALVLSQSLPVNIALLNEGDSHALFDMRIKIKRAVEKHAKERYQRPLDCDFHRLRGDMIKSFWKHQKALSTSDDRIHQGKLRMGKGGFLMPFYDDAFILRRKLNV